MKFLKNSLQGILGRSLATATLLFALLLSGFVTSYGNTTTTILQTATTSPNKLQTNSKRVSAAAFPAFALGRQSLEQQKTFTNFTGSKIPRFSEINRRSSLNLAEQIPRQSDLSVNSNIFSSVNLRITPANHYENSLSNGISTTELPYSDANRATNLKIFARLQEKNLKILLTGKQKQSFRQQFSEFEIGRTSEVFHKPKSNLPGSWQRWTRGQPRFVES